MATRNMVDPTREITRMLRELQAGNSEACAELISAVYDDLRQLAAGKMARERKDHTLSATAVVHEVAARFLTHELDRVKDREQLFAFASRSMRNLLIDHARAKGRLVRGGDRRQVPMDDAQLADRKQCEELLAINEALDSLSEIEPRKAQIVEMRYFGRMTNEEIADALDISVTTVKRDWQVAKGWLFRAVSE